MDYFSFLRINRYQENNKAEAIKYD